MVHVGPGWDLLKEVLTFRIYLLTKSEPSECGEQGKGDARFPSLSRMSQGHCVFGPCEHVPFCHHGGGPRGGWGKDRARQMLPGLATKGVKAGRGQALGLGGTSRWLARSLARAGASTPG